MKPRRLILLIAATLLLAFAAAAQPPQTTAQPPRKTPLRGTPMERLLESARKNGTISVIVRVRLDETYVPEPRLAAEAKQQRRAEIRRRKDAVIARHPRMRVKKTRDFSSLPAFTAMVDEQALRELAADERVEAVVEDARAEPTLAQSIPIVGADVAWTSPYNVKGANQVIVVVDTGVDKNHAFLKDAQNNTRVVAEACFTTSQGLSTETCPCEDGTANPCDSRPNQAVTDIGPGTAVPCTLNGTAIAGCDHGTRVAGVAAGSGTSFSGVAPEAKIIAISVGSAFSCGNPTDCPTGYSVAIWYSDVVAALDWVYDEILATRTDVVALNMSFAWSASLFGLSDSSCDSNTSLTDLVNVINNIHESGVALVAGAGNNGYYDSGLPAPACIGNVIAAGATSDSDAVTAYSNSAPNVDLLAPGGDATNGITSSVPGGGFATSHGTSFSAPHIAGAFALLRQYVPNASVDDLLAHFIANGVPVTDSRNNITKPRLDIAEALDDIEELDTEPPTAPSGVVATATSTTAVQIGWNASQDNVGVATYVVERKTLHSQAQWDLVASVPGNTSPLSVTDNGRTASTTYAYRVRAVDAAQNATASATDYATTVLHPDNPIREPWEQSGPTFVLGTHLGKLREAADAWRNHAGLGDSFTSYAAQTGPIEDTDFTGIITALNAARAQVGLGNFAYTNGVSTPAANVAVDDDHVQQLRDVMK